MLMKRKNRREKSEREFSEWGGTLIVKIRLFLGCLIGTSYHKETGKGGSWYLDTSKK